MFQKTYPKLPEKGYGQLQVYSLLPKELDPCEIKFSLSNGEIEDIQMSVMNSSFARYQIYDNQFPSSSGIWAI